MRNLILTTILCLLALSVSAREKVLSFPAQTEITIDGALDEWADHGLYHFDDRMYSIGLRYDDNHLYMIIATRSRPLMEAIERGGLTVWINPKDKEKKKYGLYCLGDVGIEPDTSSIPSRKMTYEQQQRFEEKRKQMKGKIKVVINQTPMLTDKGHSGGYDAATSMYKDVYLVELRFPLVKDDLDSNYVPISKKGKYAIGLEWGMKMPDVDRSKSREMMGDMGGRKGGGMRGGGGGKGNRMGGGPSPEMDRMQNLKELLKDSWFTAEIKKGE